MNCQELREYFERERRAFSECPEIADHLSSCTSCSSFVQAEEEMRASLGLVREAVPDVPGSLDRVVLANFRERVRDVQRAKETRTPRKLVFASIAWATAVALAVFVAYGEIALFLHPDHVRIWNSSHALPQSIRRVTPEQNSIAIQTPRVSHSPEAAKHVSIVAGPRTARPQVTAQDRSQSLEFHSLMYCDELSCGSGMEVIRVRVPASSLGMLPARAPANELVSADVLVGPDGIARGIRVAE